MALHGTPGYCRDLKLRLAECENCAGIGVLGVPELRRLDDGLSDLGCPEAALVRKWAVVPVSFQNHSAQFEQDQLMIARSNRLPISIGPISYCQKGSNDIAWRL